MPDTFALRLRLENGSNSTYWVKKIQRIIEWDEVDNALRFREWTVLRFWGKDIMRDTEACVRVVEETVEEMMMGARIDRDDQREI